MHGRTPSLIVLAFLVVLLAPILHVYVLTTRGMRGSADELAATQLCLHLLEGLQAIPTEEIPGEFVESPAEGLPRALLDRIG